MQVTSYRSFDSSPRIRRLLSGQPETPQTIQEDRREDAEVARSQYRRELGRRSLERGVFGGALGAALLGGAYNMPYGFVLGATFGAGVGLYTAWESLHRENTGKVSVTHDGKTYNKPFVGHPSKVELSPSEAQAIFKSRGADSSQVQPFQGKIELAGDTAAWRPHAATLSQLAEQRRLVAQLGQDSGDGQKAVHLVDALTAADLAQQGMAVYVVNAQPAQDTEHSLTMLGFNVARTQSDSQEFRYKERGLDYQLTPLKTPGDLANVGQAAGVPEGMFGLLENANHYAEIVHAGQNLASAETYSPEFGTAPTRSSDRSSRDERSRVQNSHLNFESGLTTRYHLNYPGLLGLAGTAAGLVTAMAVTGPGVPGPALMAATVGFLAGRAAGRAIIER